MKEKLSAIKILAIDVDGVLTDGSLLYDSQLQHTKAFHVHDGLGIRLAMNNGLKVVIITGHNTKAVEHRAKELELSALYQGVRDKGAVIRDLQAEFGVKPQEIAYIGDDINDIPAFETGCFRIAVRNASEDLKAISDYVTKKEGGFGAVREVIELIFKSKGQWDKIVADFVEYLKNGNEELFLQ